jgi:hypothetical protein
VRPSNRFLLPAALALGSWACDSTSQSPVAPPPVVAPAPVVVQAAPPTVAAPPPGCAGAQPKDPVEYGVCKLQQALARAGSSAKVDVIIATNPAAAAGEGAKLDARPESYVIVPQGDATLVVGRDAVGAMYGALDVVERLDESGAAALPIHAPVSASPAVAFRAANPFLVIPAEGETSWWFLDTGFWTEFLDMMARGRLNFLDMHAMYNLKTTTFPNALLWFANSASAPNVGIPAAARAQNLAMLQTVVRMAQVRGIQVGLMSYRADLSIYGNKDEAALDEPGVEAYTREAVADLTSRVQGLSYFGFRVGESKRKASWFTETYIAGLQASHTNVKSYTRTWLTPKKSLFPVLGAAGSDTIVEAKYNGEQLGPPYIISGGHMPGWQSYSYEDYLTPPDPYKVVLQIRASGTHRIFRYSSYARTARTVRSLDISPRITGFTFEAAHAYSPQRDFYHASPQDVYSPWTFRRDEMSYLLFGRLGYDPATPEGVFRTWLAQRVGTKDLWDIVQAASDIVPWIQTANTCGPDQRDYAPELELGGPVGFWAAPSNAPSPMGKACHRGHTAFDSFAVAMPYEAAEDLVAGRGTARLSPVDIAQIVLANAKVAHGASQVKIDPANAEARDYVRECTVLADLGDWFGHKLRGATALAVYERSGTEEWLEAARSETAMADAAFRKVAEDTSYIAPFEEPMRMSMKHFGISRFHWKDEVAQLAADPASIEAAVQEVHARAPRAARPLPHAKAWLDAPRGDGPGLVDLTISPRDARAPAWTVTVKLASAVPAGARVSVLRRPFPSDAADWSAVQATPGPGGAPGTVWVATIPGTGVGTMVAVEVDGGPGQSFLYPDSRKDQPYRSVAP